MSENEMATLRRKYGMQIDEELLGSAAIQASKDVLYCLDIIEGQRAVIAERDATIAEQLERFNVGWEHLHTNANEALAEKNREIERLQRDAADLNSLLDSIYSICMEKGEPYKRLRSIAALVGLPPVPEADNA